MYKRKKTVGYCATIKKKKKIYIFKADHNKIGVWLEKYNLCLS